MEQRKLIAHGASSLTMALPIKWVKHYGLTKGDPIFVEEEGNKLILSIKESKKSEKVSINITKLDRTSTLIAIMSLYRFGYNEIEVRFDKITTPHHRLQKDITYSSVIHEITARLIGAEIIEQTSNRILIKVVAREADEDFLTILRRIFLLLKETAEGLLEGIIKKDINLIRTVEEKHDNINKFIVYCLRMLNRTGYPDVKKTCYYFHIIASIDKIVDVLKYNARQIQHYKRPFNSETIKIWKYVNESIVDYYSLFYKFDLDTVTKMNSNRDHVKSLISSNIKKIPQEELLYLNDMKQILEILLDLTDYRIGLEY